MSIVRADLVFAEDHFHRDHAFVMRGPALEATGTLAQLAERFGGEEIEDWGHVAVVPGTVNGHAHSFQALLRGYGDDLPFMTWRDRVLYPFSELLDIDSIATGALLDFSEMARAGVTTVTDFFYLNDGGIENARAVIAAAGEVGMRIVLARTMYDWTGAPKRYREPPDLAVQNIRALHDLFRADTRAFVQPAPHSVHGASPRMIQEGAALAEELDEAFHIHVAEGRYERERTISDHGVSPVHYLDQLGVLNERAVLIDCVWIDDDDLSLIADRGASVVHNPGANAFLGDGIAPLRKMLERGIPVCLGTDGGCTNSRQSVFDDMRTAALLAKAVDADASAIRAEDVLLAGTARGGQVLRLPVGRIAPGHAADLVVLDLDDLSMQPPATAHKQLIYSMQPSAIRRVIVGGQPIVENGQVLGVDEDALRARIARATSAWERA
ncbi:MAG: amidohydrolase family protein [Actinomycetota bacterium]